MGSDKARLNVRGRPLIDHVASSLAALSSSILVVGGAVDLLELLSPTTTPTRWVEDAFPGEGPLGGVITALREFQDHPFAAVVSCDLVGLDPKLIELLRREVDRENTALAIPVDDEGVPQWHVSVWRTNALDMIVAEFTAGTRSFRQAVASIGVRQVRTDTVVQDLDTPTDVETYESRK